jgi:hypothetical protein
VSGDHAAWCKSRSAAHCACDCHNVAAEIARAQEIFLACNPKWVAEGKIVAVRYPGNLTVEVQFESGRVAACSGLPAVEIRWAGKKEGQS